MIDALVEVLFYILEFGFPNYLIHRPGSPLIRMFGVFMFLPWIVLWLAMLPILYAGAGIEQLIEVWKGTL